MITTLEQYESEIVDDQLQKDQYSTGFYYGRKMMILESNWESEDVFNNISVYPFLSNMSNLLGNQYPIKVGHRYFDSVRGLKYYVQYPEGKLWSDPNAFGTSVFHIATHGGPTSILTTLDIIRKDGLLDSLKGFDAYPNILFFSGCGVFCGTDGDDFGYDLLGSSGTRAILGYKSQYVEFSLGLITELLFLNRFFLIEDEDPFNRLNDVYNSVMNDFKPAQAMEFTMYLR